MTFSRPRIQTCGIRPRWRVPDGIVGAHQVPRRSRRAGAKLEILPNPGPAAQPSLLVDREHARAVAQWLRDDTELRLDYCSNFTGVDWPEVERIEKVRVKMLVDGVEKEVEESRKTKSGGYLEVVYHHLFDGATPRAGDCADAH